MCTAFIKACDELKKHQLRLAEWEKETSDADDDEEEEEEEREEKEETKGEDKMEEDEDEEEEEEDMSLNGTLDSSALEVSSTSISPPKKRARLMVSVQTFQ